MLETQEDFHSMTFHRPESFGVNRIGGFFDENNDSSLISQNVLPEFHRIGSEWSGNTPSKFAETRELADKKGRTVFLPVGYEPNYPYPLIVWLHEDGGSEQDLQRVMRQISTRNYVGLCLRGSIPAVEGIKVGYRYSLTDSGLDKIEDDLFSSVRELKRHIHLHTERVYLAGFRSGGRVALKLMLNRPAWFQGAVVLGSDLSQDRFTLHQLDALRGSRAMLGLGSQDRSTCIESMVETGRLLNTAGVDVTSRIYHTGSELTPIMLRDVNHWLMNGICATVCET